MWAPVRAERRALTLALALLAGPVAAQQRPPLPPPLPPDPPTGFFVTYRVDGRPVKQTLYGFRHHAWAVLPPADDAPGDPQRRSLWLDLRSHAHDPVQEGIALRVQDALRLDARGEQRFVLNGHAFCKPAAEQPADIRHRAEYAMARPGAKGHAGGHFRWGSPLAEGTLADEQASDQPLGYVTGAPGLTGAFEGELVVTRIDRVSQVLEGRFRFDAGRHITTRRKPTGEWEGRCWEAGDFAVGRVRITDGEFRVRYCLDPVQPGNHRSCPDGLSPQLSR